MAANCTNMTCFACSMVFRSSTSICRNRTAIASKEKNETWKTCKVYYQKEWHKTNDLFCSGHRC